MSTIAAAIDPLIAEIEARAAGLGAAVDVRGLGVLDRTGELALGPPGGRVSPNRACRLFRAADGWMALNLAREEDHDLVPAWLGCGFDDGPWALVEAHGPERTRADLVAGAALLGLPAAAVGETRSGTPDALRLRMAAGGERLTRPPRVVEISALWAGPMCGAILASAGAEVTRIDSVRRPDPSETSTPGFFRRLNGGKARLALDLAAPADQARLRAAILAADVVVTGFRPRALAGLGLDPGALFAARPGLVWVAVTGHGWTGTGAGRVAFGDDAAAAGGLVGRTADGGPCFLGDALADPVTGLSAAAGALAALAEGGGQLVDAALARCAAGAAAVCGVG